MREAEFSRYLVEKLREHGHVTRIESATSRGIPDIHICAGGVSEWIETKIIQGNRVILRPEQFVWMRDETKAGGNCSIIGRNKEGDLFSIFPFSKALEWFEQESELLGKVKKGFSIDVTQGVYFTCIKDFPNILEQYFGSSS